MVRPQRSGKQAGYSLRSQLQDLGLTDLSPGAVIEVPDKHLSFPHNLLNRTVHERRFAVVLSNDYICQDRHTPLIVIVPMTHNTSIRNKTDVLIERAPENGLTSDSLAQLALIQPVIKSSVNTKLGMLSDEDYESLLIALVAMTSR